MPLGITYRKMGCVLPSVSRAQNPDYDYEHDYEHEHEHQHEYNRIIA